MSLAVGTRFWGWTVLGTTGTHYAFCVCDCGASRDVLVSTLRKGESRSCGCGAAGTKGAVKITHGETFRGSMSKEFRTWNGMIQRCHNPADKGFRHYGGRGISVHKPWRRDYSEFLKAVGRAPSAKHSLDRVNNDGNYEPGNVRWATKREQCRNTGRTIFVEVEGVEVKLVDLADQHDAPYSLVIGRYFRGWPLSELFGPKRPHYGGRKRKAA